MKIKMMDILKSVRRGAVTGKGGPQGTPKGNRGYNRKRAKMTLRKEDY